MKICSKCQTEKDLSEFHKGSSKKDGLRADCKTCNRKRVLSYYYENREDRILAKKSRESGLSKDQIDFLVKQSDQCPACNRKFDPQNRPCIDHDHSCCPSLPSCGLCFRGIICTRCNLVAGLVEDNTEILFGIIEYLKKVKIG